MPWRKFATTATNRTLVGQPTELLHRGVAVVPHDHDAGSTSLMEVRPNLIAVAVPQATWQKRRLVVTSTSE